MKIYIHLNEDIKYHLQGLYRKDRTENIFLRRIIHKRPASQYINVKSLSAEICPNIVCVI